MWTREPFAGGIGQLGLLNHADDEEQTSMLGSWQWGSSRSGLTVQH